MAKSRRWPFALLMTFACACGARSNLWDDDESPQQADPRATTDAGRSISIGDARAPSDAASAQDAAMDGGAELDASSSCPAFSSAPSGSAYWAQTIGGLGAITGIAADFAGNLIVVGNAYSSKLTIGSSSITNTSGPQPTFIAKLDEAGNVVFFKGFSGGDQHAGGVAVDDTGNIIITGMFFDTINFGDDPSTALRSEGRTGGIYFAKLDPNGDQIWAKAFVASGVCWGGQVSVTPQNDIVVSGSFESTIYFSNTADAASFTNTGEDDEPFVAKFTATGDLIWTRAFAVPSKAQTPPGGFAPYGFVSGQSVDPQGNIYISGAFVESLTFSKPLADGGAGTITAFSGTNNSGEGFITKIDADGNYIWGRALPSNGFTNAPSIAADSEGDVVGCGDVVGALQFSEIDAGLYADNEPGDGVGEIIFGIDPATGAATWLTPIGGSTGEGASIAFDNANNLFVGSSIGTSDGPLSSRPADEQGLFAARFTAKGIPLWSKTFGAARDDVNSVAVDRCGRGLYLGGLIFDDATFPRADGSGDILIHAADAGVYSTMFVARLAR